MILSTNYDGGAIPDADLRDAYPVPEWRVASWREATFGLRWPGLEATIDLWLGDAYLNGHGSNPYFLDASLPPGRDRSWKRGTWASVPVTLLDRESALWIECKACEDRARDRAAR